MPKPSPAKTRITDGKRRGRPRKQAGTKRSLRIEVLVNETEDAEIRRRARLLGYSRSAYLRNGGTAGWVRRVDVIQELGSIAQRIEPALKRLAALGEPASASVAYEALRELTGICKKL